jgi:hypothetical protein
MQRRCVVVLLLAVSVVKVAVSIVQGFDLAAHLPRELTIHDGRLVAVDDFAAGSLVLELPQSAVLTKQPEGLTTLRSHSAQDT